jgi:hypothetical protein
MGLFDSLKKAAEAFIEDLNTPESFKKGQKFEEYVRNTIFTSDRYKLIKKTHDYKQNSADFVQETLEPDYKFECIETKRQFYVEAKFRSWFYQGKIEFCKDGQFKRLTDINKKEPVFVIIGIDGDPDDPHYICLVPMSDIKGTSLTEDFLENYDIAIDKSISPTRLWSQTKSVGKPVKSNSSGYCIRCKTELAFDIGHPLCKSCYSEWNKYKNPDYTEKYCHMCGTSLKSSMAKPICYSCYKSK